MFEKWKNNNKSLEAMKKQYFQATIARVTWDSLEEVMEYTWKAALECILDNNDSYCPGKINTHGKWEDCPMAIVIKKELDQ